MSKDIRAYFSVKSTNVKTGIGNNSESRKSVKKPLTANSNSEEELKRDNSKPRRQYGKLKVKRTSVLSSSDEDVPSKRRKSERKSSKRKSKNSNLSDEFSDKDTLNFEETNISNSDKKATTSKPSSDKQAETSKTSGKNRKQPSYKRKCTVLSEESSEDEIINSESSVNIIPSKLPVVITKSPYFKPAKAEDVFGREPVERCLSLAEEADDMEFEAALLKLEEADVNRTSKVQSPENKIEKKLIEVDPNLEKHPEQNVTSKEYLNKVSVNEVDDDRKSGPKVQQICQKSLTLEDVQVTKVDVVKIDDGYDSPIYKLRKLPKTDSPGCDSSAVNQDKSSPGDSAFNSQESFTDSQDSGVVANSRTINKIRLTTETAIQNKSVSAVKSNDVPTMKKSLVTPVVKDVQIAASKRVDSTLWVDKYKPQSTSKLIGQQGERSNVNKLKNWLSKWYQNNARRKKTNCMPNNWNSDPNGYDYKAALLSGPPGVGKTTSVDLVCKELNFDVVEFNASDTRSKNSLQKQISELLTSTSLNSSFNNDSNRNNNLRVNRNRVLVMDEVDGMAGNEDRGGMNELIALIKRSKIPIICICNDRSHPKVRSLANYCFDLRYARPRVEQIKGYMMSICYKEHLHIPQDVLTDIIVNTHNDIRLTLNLLSMLAADKSNNNLYSDKKNVKIGPWDVVRMVFSSEEHKKMSIHDQCDLFFYDYNSAPLFVHQNYLSVKPHNPAAKDNVKKMELFALAADSIAVGEEISTCIRKSSAWSLLPVQAIFSSYVPGCILEGHCSGQIGFPSWFPQNSRQVKMSRLAQEVQVHTRLKVSGSKRAILLDYIYHLRNSIIAPLVQHGTDGVKTSIDKLRDYDLLKEDLDSLNELCTWPEKESLFSKLDSKVKSAFTRMYNKEKPVCPYSLSAPIKKGKQSNGDDVEGLLLDGNEGDGNTEPMEDDDEDDDNADAMIIEKKKPSKQTSTSIKAPPTPSSSNNSNTNGKSKAKKLTQNKKSKR